MTKREKQFGLWPSSITPDFLGSARRLSDFSFGAGDQVFWLESRSEKSMICYANWSETDPVRELNPDLHCKGKLGYGGGDFKAYGNNVYFSERTSGRIYRQTSGLMNAAPLTPDHGKAAAPEISADGKYVAYIHNDDADVDRIAVIDAEGKHWPQIFEQGADFYTQLRFSPDGKYFAFVSWCHPNMPWEASALFLGRVEYSDGGLPRLRQIKRIAGGPGKSVFQPEFLPDSRTISYIADDSGYGHLYLQELESGHIRALTSGSDFELGMPNWLQDMRTYCIAEQGKTIVTAINKKGFIRLHTLDVASGKLNLIEELADFSEINRIVAADDGHRLLIGGSSWDQAGCVFGFDLTTRKIRTFARSVDLNFPPEDLSKPAAVSWRTGKMEECHGLMYLPANGKYTDKKHKPPLIVHIHGGPTAQATARFNLEIQFFTNRGFAVLAVNYRGSTGYGRAYWEKLNGKWGVADVDDAVFGLKHFADAGVVDGSKGVIMGGSAGGYTVLQTLVREPDVFAAGISLYGIANLFSLAKDTHKFESHYNHSLVGPLPEAAGLYRDRSPEFHAAKIRRPLAVFQGDSDVVVPKSQAEAIVKAVARAGVPHIYHLYEGEGHGFRKSETIQHLYTAIEDFIQEHVIFK